MHHWKCRVRVKLHRGFESLPLRLNEDRRFAAVFCFHGEPRPSGSGWEARTRSVTVAVHRSTALTNPHIFTLLGLLMQIVGDTLYTIVDPRIDFEARR